MDKVRYFSGLVENDESLTADIDDTTAAEVMEFALSIARIIGESSIDHENKEARFKSCMGTIRQICKIIADSNEVNMPESIIKIKDLSRSCVTTAYSG